MDDLTTGQIVALIVIGCCILTVIIAYPICLRMSAEEKAKNEKR